MTGEESEGGDGAGGTDDGHVDDPTERVEAALRRTRDPEADLDVFEAGLVTGVRVEDGRAVIEADLTGFDPRTSEEVVETILRAVRTVEGVENVHVEPGTQSAGDRVTIAGVDTVVAVASTKGGVGKTTVATNLACGLAADETVGLFDADIFGPNVTEILGLEGPIRTDEQDRPLPVRVGGTGGVEGTTGAADGANGTGASMEAISVGLMTDGGPLAWRGAMAHDALTELFEETAWGDRDTLVIDLPPGTGDVVLTTLQEVPVDGVVVVTTPFHTSVADTRRSLRLFHENDVPVLGVVVNMGTFTCDVCGEVHDLFPGGSPVEELDVPVLAELPFTPEMQTAPRPGAPVAGFESIVDGVRERLDEVWNPAIPEEALDLRDVPGERRRAAVREAFGGLESGDPFVVVSDRDPSPMYEFLAELAGVDDPDEAFETFRVRKHNPETWLLETVRP